MAAFGFHAPHQNTVGRQQIRNGGAFGQEFGVGEHFKMQGTGAGGQNALQGLGGAHGHGAFLDDDLVGFGVFEDQAGHRLDVFEVGGLSGTLSEGLGGGIDRYEDNIAFFDASGHFGREEEVAPAVAEHDLIEPRFVDGQVVAVPLADTLRIDVHEFNTVLGTFVGDDGHRGTAHVSGAYAENSLLKIHLLK